MKKSTKKSARTKSAKSRKPRAPRTSAAKTVKKPTAKKTAASKPALKTLVLPTKKPGTKLYNIGARRVELIHVTKVDGAVSYSINGESGFVTTSVKSFLQTYSTPTEAQLKKPVAAKKSAAAKKTARKPGELSVNEQRLLTPKQVECAKAWKGTAKAAREKLIAKAVYAGKSFKDKVEKYVKLDWAGLSEALRRALKPKLVK